MKRIFLTIMLVAAATYMTPHSAMARDDGAAGAKPGWTLFGSFKRNRAHARAPGNRVYRGNRVNRSIYSRQVVKAGTQHAPGTILIDTKRYFLYLVQKDGMAVRYGVGVGRPGFEWTGTNRISRKAEWPDWVPPAQMRARQPYLPAFMPGGPSNPLGARALYLGSTLYRIHGTNEARTIGEAVSSGCIRMLNEDVIDLYSRVDIGTKVVVF